VVGGVSPHVWGRAGGGAAARSSSPAEVAAKFLASNERLMATVDSLDDGWTALAESPVGHITVGLVVHHGLWDSWVHERDIAIPLARPVVVEGDEVAAGLAYATALSAAFAMLAGSPLHGSLVLESTDPDGEFVVTVGDDVCLAPGSSGTTAAPRLRGDAVTLLEQVSARTPMPAGVPDEWRVLLAGLHDTFEQSLD
jgi:hypothetical protein